MEREANYVAVGAFVVLILVLGGLFVYWYTDSYDRRSYERYEIYFEGTVTGLARGAAVQYLGVSVGRVVTMRVDRREPGRVQVIADIDSDTPISTHTVAQLTLQGVTGLLYIDLNDNPENRKVSAPVPSERYPVIPSVRSNFDVFVSSLPSLAGQAARILERVERLLSDRNVTAVGNTLGSIEQASGELPRTLRDVQGLVTELRATTREISAAAESMRAVTDQAGPQVTASIAQVRTIAENLARTTTRLDRFLADSQRDLGSFTRDGLPEFERLLHDSRAAANEFRELSRSLRADPSQLIYQPSYRGVEVPR
ncbi:MAG: MCE family protein [Gammaproteobacteria bacterium]|nr:MCE family protein [Gammaproteobacteria bacterium]